MYFIYKEAPKNKEIIKKIFNKRYFIYKEYKLIN